MKFRALSKPWSDEVPHDAAERKKRLARARYEYRMCRKELAELDKYLDREQTIRARMRHMLRIISKLENAQ